MTRAQFGELTRQQGLTWHTPPECSGRIVVTRYAESDGWYWRAVEDMSLPPDHPDRVELFRADARHTNPARWQPWNWEPRGIRWRPVDVEAAR